MSICGSGHAREESNAVDGTGFAGVRGHARSHKISQAFDCCQIGNNPLRQFVFFSYNFPYILPAAS